MHNPRKVVLLILCISLFSIVQIWKHTATLGIADWNGKAISKMTTTDPEVFSFALFGDNKDGPVLFDALLHDIDNKKEASFAINMGDFVAAGGRKELRGFIGEIQDDLDIPLVAVIGNHDLHQGSSTHYRKVFGNPYYRFAIGRNEFIVLDSSDEAGLDAAQRKWLKAVLEETQAADNRYIFMHIPPFDPRGKGFKKHLRDGRSLIDLFRRYHVTHLFAGHIHGYFSGVWKGLAYTITGGGGARLQAKEDHYHYFHHYLLAHVNHGKLSVSVRPVKADLKMHVFDSIEDHPMEWGLLLLATSALLFLFAAFNQTRKGMIMGKNKAD